MSTCNNGWRCCDKRQQQVRNCYADCLRGKLSINISMSDMPSIAALIGATQSRHFSGSYDDATRFSNKPTRHASHRNDATLIPASTIVSSDRDKADYCDDDVFVGAADRFNSDFAAEDKRNRHGAALRKVADLARRRAEVYYVLQQRKSTRALTFTM